MIFHRIGLIVTIPLFIIASIIAGLLTGLVMGYGAFMEEWRKS